MFTKLLDKIKLNSYRDQTELIVDLDRVIVIKNKIIVEEVKLNRIMRSIDVKATPRAFKLGPDTVTCFTSKSIASVSEVNVTLSKELEGKISTVLGQEAVLLTQRYIHMDEEQLKQYDQVDRELYNFSYCINDTRDSVVLAYMFFKGINRAVHSKFTGILTDLEKGKRIHIPAPGLNTNAIDFSELGIVSTAMDLKDAERYFQLYKEKSYQPSMFNIPTKTISVIDDTAYGVITNITENVKKHPWILYLNTDHTKPVVSYNTGNVVRISPTSIDTADLIGTIESKEMQLNRQLENTIKDNGMMKWDYVLLDNLSIDPKILPDAPTIVCNPNLRKELFLEDDRLKEYLKVFKPGILHEGEQWGFLPYNLEFSQVGDMEVRVGKTIIPVVDLIEHILRKYGSVKVEPKKIIPIQLCQKADMGPTPTMEDVVYEILETKGIEKGKITLPNMIPFINKYSRDVLETYHIIDLNESVTEIAKCSYKDSKANLTIARVNPKETTNKHITKEASGKLIEADLTKTYDAIVSGEIPIVDFEEGTVVHKTNKLVIVQTR